MIEIVEESLHNKLMEYKEYIGKKKSTGFLTVLGGLAFFYTVWSGKESSALLNDYNNGMGYWDLLMSHTNVLFFFSCAVLQSILGVFQILKGLIKPLDAERLFKEIKSLDTSSNRYSLVAIRDDFNGENSNRVLARFFDGKWKEYMFLSFPTAEEKDVESVIKALAGSLKVPLDSIHLHYNTSLYQPKLSPDYKKVRAYYNNYYIASIDSFPEKLKKNYFEIDGIKYKWMTLEQMEKDAKKKKNNEDVRQTFSHFINTPIPNSRSFREYRNATPLFPYNVCIRLNRHCNLSCRFCLACNNSTLEIKKEDAKQCLSILKSNGVKRARLCGGEPTMHPDFFEIVKYSINLQMETVIYSNLFITDKDFITNLKGLPISVVTSIHGDDDYHDSITQVKGSCKTTCNNIKELTKEKIPTAIHMVLTGENVNEVENVIQKAISLGVWKVTVQTLIPREKGRQFINEKGISQGEIRAQLNSLKYLAEKYKNQITIHFNDMYEKEYYVLEPDGSIYLEGENEMFNHLFRRLI